MKTFLQDLVGHTHALGVIPLLRVTATADKTYVDAVSEDRVMLFNCTTKIPVANINGVFGMTSLNKLDLHLKCPEYATNAGINLVTDVRDGEVLPTGIHFSNEAGDFQNDFRFMSRKIVDIKMKAAEFLGTQWDIEFEPTIANIQRFKFQASAHTEETTFHITTDGDKLVISMGDLNTHAGNFVFHTGITGSLRKKYVWPKSHVLNVLNLLGDKIVSIADAGALQISVDSGTAVYKYIFPAQLA